MVKRWGSGCLLGLGLLFVACASDATDAPPSVDSTVDAAGPGAPDDHEQPRDAASGSSSGDTTEAGVDATSVFRLPEFLPGVNLSGAEFAGSRQPGTYGTDYAYPKDTDADYVLGKGLSWVRIPFRWKRMQHAVQGELDAAEVARLRHMVDYVLGKGGYVVLDPHDYGRRDGIIGSGEPGAATREDFADFWTRLASLFADRPEVVLGLMNEPHGMPTELWLDNANAAIAAIRAVGARNLIAVPGNAWTGAGTWFSAVGGNRPNAEVMGGVVDPLDHYIYELHQYLDQYSTGDPSRPCVSATIGSERLTAVTGWLRERGKRAFIGEVGALADATCLAALDDMLGYIDDNRDVWQGFTYWTAGSRWNPSYGFLVQPDAEGGDRPQMSVLVQHLQ